MLDIVNEKDITPLHVSAGDTFIMTYRDKLGVLHTLLSEKIDANITINKLIVFRVKDQYGLSSGYGGMFGESS